MFSTPMRSEIRAVAVEEEEEKDGIVARCCCMARDGFDVSMLCGFD